MSGAATPVVDLEVGGRTVRLTNPDRVYFPATGATKRDLADYYLAVADGIVRALRERPCICLLYTSAFSRAVRRLSLSWPTWRLMVVGGSAMVLGYGLVTAYVGLPTVVATACCLLYTSRCV